MISQGAGCQAATQLGRSAASSHEVAAIEPTLTIVHEHNEISMQGTGVSGFRVFGAIESTLAFALRTRRGIRRRRRALLLN